MNSQIIEKYKFAWENHCLDTIEEIFHNDIVYKERHNNTLNGISEVREYWTINSRKQENVKFRTLKVFTGDSHVSCHWEATFFEKIKMKKIRLEGAMILEIEESKIINLVEFFENTKIY